jgi:hypothetical protein
MKGKELKELMRVIQGGQLGFYYTSGMKMQVTDNGNGIRALVPKTLTFNNGAKILEDTIYNTITTDYLASGKDDLGNDIVKKMFSQELIKKIDLQRKLKATVIQYLKTLPNQTIQGNAFLNDQEKRLEKIEEKNHSKMKLKLKKLKIKKI